MTKHFAPLAALVLGLAPAAVLAQSASPQPAATQPVAPLPPSMTTPAPPASTAPAPVMTMAPAPSPSAKPPAPAASAKPAPQYKKIPNGSLSVTDLRYGLTHPLQEANKVRAMKHVSFDKLRVYRLSSGLKSILKVGDANMDIPALAVLGPGTLVAQTGGLPATNGSNSPIAYLQYVLANINVSNALNNVSVLNNSNVNVGVSLQDVLNGNKISIGQVAGIFVNGLGIITTITK
jgi:hypothetical protein